jgi:hypothetical protein
MTAERFGAEKTNLTFGWIFTAHMLGAAAALGGWIKRSGRNVKSAVCHGELPFGCSGSVRRRNAPRTDQKNAQAGRSVSGRLFAVTLRRPPPAAGAVVRG